MSAQYAHSGFWLISAQMFSVFLSTLFPFSTSTLNFQRSISNARETLSQKLSLVLPKKTFFGQKRLPKGPKMGQKLFFAVFVKRTINPLGKIFQTPQK